MYKRIITLLLSLLCLLTATGCQLAREQEGKEEQGAQDKDKFIGVFITYESLGLSQAESQYFDRETGGKADTGVLDEERLYAKLKDKSFIDEETGEESKTKEYVFDGVEGISFFSAMVYATDSSENYKMAVIDEAISEGSVKHMAVLEREFMTQLEGSIYFTPDKNDGVFYMNPVYQSADGQVYALSGLGDAYSAELIQGEAHFSTFTLEEAITVKEDGKDVITGTSVSLSLDVVFKPEEIVFLEMDKNSAVLSRTQYAPGETPESLKLNGDTAYIIVETHKRDKDGRPFATRELYSVQDEAINTLICREDGINITRRTTIERIGEI